MAKASSIIHSESTTQLLILLFQPVVQFQISPLPLVESPSPKEEVIMLMQPFFPPGDL